MKKVGLEKTSRILVIGLALLLSTIILIPVSSQATDNYWIGGDGNWEDSNHWSLGYVPVGGDNVFLIQSDGYNSTVFYTNTLYPSAVLNSLTINSTGTGTMTLSLNDLPLSPNNLAATIEYIGAYSGTGAFIQSGGNTTNTVGSLYLGYNAGSQGTYDLSGGALSATNEYVSNIGTGTFNQTGGTNTVASWLDIGQMSGGIGEYNLSDTGVLTVSGDTIVGSSGTGTFNQSGGTHTTALLVLGSQPGSSGTYNFTGGILNNSAIIGDAGTGVFKNSVGTHNVTDSLILGNQSTGDGTYKLSGTGSVAVEATGWGLTIVGNYGTGKFEQSGNTTHTTDSLVLGGYDWGGAGTGTYDLSGGDLNTGQTMVGWSGTGTFNQSGGTHTVTGDVAIAVGSGSKGTYNLSGGTLNAANVINNDKFNFSGGNLNANITNNTSGTTTLSEVGTRIVNGFVINYGTWKVTDTTAVYTGTFTNLGAYISDPASQYFTDLIVNPLGYLVGGDGDYFYISGNFENHSEQNLLWNTMAADLAFTGGSSHNFDLAGADLGPNGYANNFAWSTLNITGNSLHLFDGNSTPGAALYVYELLGAVISGNTITNILGSPDLFLYYDPNDPDNAYLGGLTYALQGGGLLGPGNPGQPVPEPSTLLLLGSGLVGVVGLMRRKFKKN